MKFQFKEEILLLDEKSADRYEFKSGSQLRMQRVSGLTVMKVKDRPASCWAKRPHTGRASNSQQKLHI